MDNEEYKEVVVSLEDEVFYDCMCEMEEYIADGWSTVKIEKDDTTNTIWMTMKKTMLKSACA